MGSRTAGSPLKLIQTKKNLLNPGKRNLKNACKGTDRKDV